MILCITDIENQGGMSIWGSDWKKGRVGKVWS